MERPRKNHQCLFEIQEAQLERRDVPASNLGNTFAIVPGEITKAGDAAVIKVNLTSDLFTIPKGRATLGVAVAATTASTVQPLISKVVNGTNKSVVQPAAPGAGKTVSAAVVTTKTATPSLLNVQLNKGQKSSSYSVSVKDKASGKGNFLSGFYLPGDANGDLKVDKTDLTAIKSKIGAKVGAANYDFNADSNRDGQIDNADVKLAQSNQGVVIKVKPMITARLDPASDTGTADRITDNRNVQFQGVATPGSTVTYTEVDSKTTPVSTKADATGNYTLTASLADGTNLYRVNATDSFGQTISGLLSPVTYKTNPPGKV